MLQLHENVREWQDTLQPILNMEEKRAEFNFDKYFCFASAPCTTGIFLGSNR